MFTGIIQEIGIIREAVFLGGAKRLTVDAPKSASVINVNDSIAINGVCQTVTGKRGNEFIVLAVEETLSKTTLGSLRNGHQVNLELPVKLGDRLDGHIVSGHVDCVGVVRSVLERESSWLIRVELPEGSERYVIPVGSIAIDGVSLTVADIEGGVVVVSIIPHTMKNTIFGEHRALTRVNIEFDMLGKYVERLMRNEKVPTPRTDISPDQLKSWGYEI